METKTPVSDSPAQTSVISCAADTPSPVPPKKRRITESVVTDNESECSLECFCPERMHLISVLHNDRGNKSVALHVRLEQHPDKDSIVILQKSPFPTDPKKLQTARVVNKLKLSTAHSSDTTNDASNSDSSCETFPCWRATTVMSNDVYHRLSVTAGLEAVNDIGMTIIHPAEPHHFKRYGTTGRRIVHESPHTYQTVVVPFLAEQPRDLAWVDNILAGTAEQDRILFTDDDPAFGFTLVLDYKWNGQFIHEMHCLGIARDPQLTCLRDLRASHIPMLLRILKEGRHTLATKYTADPGPLSEDQIMAYLHYPPTFYRLHVHFVHVDHRDDRGTGVCRAHLLDEVIRNLQVDDGYYTNRTITLCLHENSPMLDALHNASAQTEPSDSIHTNEHLIP